MECYPYVYNRYGTLQMSRYNVSPVGVGEVSVSGINDITSSDGTVEVSQYGDTFDLSVPDITAVSGLVEDVTELTSAVSGLTVNVEELNTAVSGLTEDVEEINTVVSSIQEDIESLTSAVSAIQVDYVTEEELSSAISAVSAMVPAAQVQSDWDENDPSSKAYILNKPDMADYVTQDELATAVSALSVQSDWEQSDSTKPDYIKNKPDMSDYVTQEELVTAVSGLGVQSDWTEQDSESPAYIQNKPEEKDLVAGDGIEITVSGTSVIISSDNPVVTGYATEVELAAVSGTLQLEIDAVSSNPRVKTVEYGVDVWSDVVSAMNGVSTGKYDYVVMKHSVNGTDLYAPLVKYTPGEAAYFVCPAHGTGNTYGYGQRRTTEVYTINPEDMWFDRTIRPFQGKLIGAGNVSVTVQGEDYIVSGTGGTFEQVNADWNATSGVAEILNKPTIPDPQVNSDWNAVSGVAQILNKPTIPAPQVNSDWEAASGVAEILNKPETIEIETVGVSAGSGIAITEVASGIVISCTVTGGPGSSYSAGSGIDITNDVISVDNTVALKTDIPTYTAGQGISVSGGVISVLYTTIDFTGTVTCPTCNGTGSVTSTESCPLCGGQGGYESYETCSECNGSGTVSCSTCNGTGHIDELCTTCGGQGTVMCESCGGTGCESCDYNGYVTCMDCQGTGYIMCSMCAGSGEYPCGNCGGTGGNSTYNTCSECDGTGTIQTSVTCNTCSGTGQIEE